MITEAPPPPNFLADEPDLETPTPVEAIESELSDNLGEGFCNDDVYATYLRKKYDKQLVTHKGPPLKHKKKSRQKHGPNSDTKAAFYIRRTLNGPVDPYFGGIPVVANERVEQWVRYFKNEGRPTFIKWLVRAESFKKIVEPALAQEGLPQELFYLAMIESGFSNTASSVKSATGTWQFMKGTAQLYNLRIDHWVDERRDPIKSTIAAARYLRDLYGMFGDWYLAMAAYNAGPGKVRSAIRRSGSTDFWKIAETAYIKPETKNYVPKVLAALNLSSNARRHGFGVSADEQHDLPKSIVELERPIALDELAKHLEISLATLKYWNPEIVRDITPPIRKQSYVLRLSQQLLEKFSDIRERLAQIEVTDILMHRIKHGETLSSIAKKYNVTIHKIKEMNPKLNVKALRIGHELAIPIPGIVLKRPVASAANQEMG